MQTVLVPDTAQVLDARCPGGAFLQILLQSCTAKPPRHFLQVMDVVLSCCIHCQDFMKRDNDLLSTLQQVLYFSLKIAGADIIPNWTRLYWKNSRWVLIATNFLDASSSATICLLYSALKIQYYLLAASLVQVFSTHSIGYVSMFAARLRTPNRAGFFNAC